MSEKLTPAQRNYLEVADRRPLLFTEIRAGTSLRCANALVSRGLLQRNHDEREFCITSAGHLAIKPGEKQ